MGTVSVVIVAPCGNQMAGMAQGIEQVLVQAFVAHPAIEAFHKTILHRLASRWKRAFGTTRDVMPLDLTIFLPLEDGIRCEFRPVACRGEAFLSGCGHLRSSHIA